MSGNERFRRDVGLLEDFAEAQARWRQPPAGRQTRAPNEAPLIPELRKRFEPAVVEYLKPSKPERSLKGMTKRERDTELKRRAKAERERELKAEAAQTQLGILSPWYAPPTDEEVTATRVQVKAALSATQKSIDELLQVEGREVPWYATRADVPGIEDSLVDDLGPGNAMMGSLDPVPVLMVCRALLERHLRAIDGARPTAEAGVRKPQMHAIVEVMLQAAPKTKEVVEVLNGLGVKGATRGAVDQHASKRRKNGAAQPSRGGAPRGARTPRKSK